MTTVIRLHPDTPVTKHWFDDAPKDTLLVRSDFLTLQGEGPFMGQRCHFVRLAGCNYGDKTHHCGGLHLSCDTDFRVAESTRLTFDELEARLRPSVMDNRLRVVVTGGEPLLQSANLTRFIQRLVSSDSVEYKVQIETNGTHLDELRDLLLTYPSTYLEVVCSPKAHEVNGYSETFLRHLTSLADRHLNLSLKFLVGTGPYADLPEWVLAVLTARRRFGKVFLSPITVYADTYDGEIANSWDPSLVNIPATAANHARAAELAVKHGFRLSVQMHNFCTIP